MGCKYLSPSQATKAQTRLSKCADLPCSVLRMSLHILFDMSQNPTSWLKHIYILINAIISFIKLAINFFTNKWSLQIIGLATFLVVTIVLEVPTIDELMPSGSNNLGVIMFS